MNETARGTIYDRAVRDKEKKLQRYKGRCLLEQIKKKLRCLEKFDKQNKFNLDMESKAISL